MLTRRCSTVACSCPREPNYTLFWPLAWLTFNLLSGQTKQLAACFQVCPETLFWPLLVLLIAHDCSTHRRDLCTRIMHKPRVGVVPSLRVHLMEPDFLLTACRFPSRVDTNSRLSGRETVVALQNPCTKQSNRNYYSEIRQNWFIIQG